MKGKTWQCRLALLCVLGSTPLCAGVVDPDCTPEKAVRSATMKATVGVSGRCSVAETASDTAKKAVGIEQKGPVEKHRDDEGAARKAAKATRKAVAN